MLVLRASADCWAPTWTCNALTIPAPAELWHDHLPAAPGDSAQKEFSATWGLGFALDTAAEFRNILITSLKAGLVMVVLKELYIIEGAPH